jgi:hypothetical protein
LIQIALLFQSLGRNMMIRLVVAAAAVRQRSKPHTGRYGVRQRLGVRTAGG